MQPILNARRLERFGALFGVMTLVTACASAYEQPTPKQTKQGTHAADDDVIRISTSAPQWVPSEWPPSDDDPPPTTDPGGGGGGGGGGTPAAQDPDHDNKELCGDIDDGTGVGQGVENMIVGEMCNAHGNKTIASFSRPKCFNRTGDQLQREQPYAETCGNAGGDWVCNSDTQTHGVYDPCACCVGQ